MSTPLQSFLFITGFMGSGKTTLSKALSRHYNCPLYEMDNEIEMVLERDITNIFLKSGEAFFRNVESEVLHEIVQKKDPGIVSTGGGAVIFPKNRKIMRNNGHIIWLSVPPGEIIARLQMHSLQRPLALYNESADLNAFIELYRNRIPAYLQCHSQIHGVGSYETVLARAIQCIGTLNNL